MRCPAPGTSSPCAAARISLLFHAPIFGNLVFPVISIDGQGRRVAMPETEVAMNKMMLKLPTSFGEAVKQVFVGTSALSLPTREMGASSSPHYIGHDPIWGQCNRHRTAEVFRPAQDGCSISAIIKKTFEVHFAKYRRRWRSDPRSISYTQGRLRDLIAGIGMALAMGGTLPPESDQHTRSSVS